MTPRQVETLKAIKDYNDEKKKGLTIEEMLFLSPYTRRQDINAILKDCPSFFHKDLIGHYWVKRLPTVKERGREQATGKPRQPVTLRERKCLRCENKFMSEGAGNRICKTCKQTVSWKSEDPIPVTNYLNRG